MPPERRTITFRGHTYPVLDRITVGRRTYFVLERLSGGPRKRYKVFDPATGPGGDLRTLYVLPRTLATAQHLKVLKRLSQANPSFPKLLDFQSRRDEFFVVMNWVWGRDLRSFLTRVRSRPRLTPSAVQAFQLFRRLAHAVTQLHHQTSCIHGDLKPENLILARNPNRIVIIDFGSAWTSERAAYRVEGDGRTDAYASPEQHRGEEAVNHQSDQFSASVVAYELLTGKLPYDGIGGKAGCPDIREAASVKLTPPSELSADRGWLPQDIWSEIDRVVLRGLALDAANRYPGRSAWLADLDAIDAMMKLPARVSGFNQAMLRALDWLGSFFGRR